MSMVLTKGLLSIELAELSSDNEYGITLISLTEAFRKRMEPHAAKHKDRLAALLPSPCLMTSEREIPSKEELYARKR